MNRTLTELADAIYQTVKGTQFTPHLSEIEWFKVAQACRDAAPSTDRDTFASALIAIALTADEDNEWDGTEKFREARATAMKALQWTDTSKPQPSDGGDK